MSTRDQEECSILRDQVSVDWRKLRLKRGREGKELIYSNQEEAAVQIQQEFTLNGRRFVTLVAQPGAGKTGTFLCVAYKVTTATDEYLVPYVNVMIITGMSDKEWKVQTQGAVIECLQNSVFHRAQFGSSDELQEKLNKIVRDKVGLIIIDECHIANDQKQTLSTLLREKRLLDPEFLLDTDIRILNVSATPASTLIDSTKLGEHHTMVRLKESPIYRGFRFYKEKGLLRHAYNLDDVIECNDLFTMASRRWKGTPKYHILRLTPSQVEARENIRKICARLGWTIKDHTSSNKVDNIDAIMANPPNRNTVYLIKNFWRAGKRLVTSHVGIAHETPTGDTNVTSQGLIPRFFDNDASPLDVQTAQLFFCDIEAVDEYLKWYEGGCDYTNTKYTSRTLKSSETGELSYRPSFVRNAAPEEEDEEDHERNTDMDHRVFDEQDDAIAFGESCGYRFRRRATNIAGADYQIHGHNPTVYQILERMQGIDASHPMRMVPTSDFKWCVYWRPSVLEAFRLSQNTA